MFRTFKFAMVAICIAVLFIPASALGGLLVRHTEWVSFAMC